MWPRLALNTWVQALGSGNSPASASRVVVIIGVHCVTIPRRIRLTDPEGASKQA